MKAKTHLFYGIVIGILLCASFGSIKKDKAEFKEEILLDSIYTTTEAINEMYFHKPTENAGYLKKAISQRSQSLEKFNKSLLEYKKTGWTIIDITTLNVRLVRSRYDERDKYYDTQQRSYEPVYYAHLAR